MPTIILDTDFLSSLLKIDRCDLIRTLYQVDRVYIPAAVHRELARTDLLTRLLEIPWIDVSPEESLDSGALDLFRGFTFFPTGVKSDTKLLQLNTLDLQAHPVRQTVSDFL
jgi:hypothetical protein